MLSGCGFTVPANRSSGGSRGVTTVCLVYSQGKNKTFKTKVRTLMYCNMSSLHEVSYTTEGLHPHSLDATLLCRPIGAREDREVSQQ